MRALLFLALALGLPACAAAAAHQAGRPAPRPHRATAPASDGPSDGPTGATGPTGTATPTTTVVGRSIRGRGIRLVTLTGHPGGRDILVVGCIHGTECAGEAITRRLVRSGPPSTGTIWVVPNLNPDGHARHTRSNARGVDLNRNFPSHWRRIGAPGTPEYSGPHPLSEPESRLAVRLITRLKPAVTIWYHQPQDVVRAWGQSIPLARHYAHLAGARFRAIPWPSGSATNWQSHTFPGTAAFVVELAPGPLPPTLAARHARAVEQLAAGR